MLSMKQIETIKEMQNMGLGAVEISKKISIDRKTATKYMNVEEFTIQPVSPKKSKSILDRWKPLIDSWLEEDRRMRFKQRHTAMRVHKRLMSEYPDSYNCSYPLVQRYMKKKKEDSDKLNGSLELVWHPGEAQADFGEADLIENGIKRTFKYLILSFPYSNAAYIQIFRGETAECVAQGLKDIFSRIGGVPLRIVFDNASGVGRKVGEKVRFAELFMRFKCHYGFQVTFCNPNSGNEKGNVENKVGYIRRNFLVPMPAFTCLEEFNKEMLNKSEKDWHRPHYKKGQMINELFSEEQKKLGDLPIKAFEVVRLERYKTDGYGKFCLDGKHHYSSKPELANQEITIGIKAHYVLVYAKNGEIICQHIRAFGEIRTDQTDYKTIIERLIKNANAWKNCGLRDELPDDIRSKFDTMPKDELRNALRILNNSTKEYSFETALLSIQEVLSRGNLDNFTVKALCARIAIEGLNNITAKGPDLGVYDEFLGGRQ